MRYLVAFDISCSRLRYRVVRCLLNYGERVQKSVFECDLPSPQRLKLSQELARLQYDASDGIRIYRICQNCDTEIETLGPNQPKGSLKTKVL